MSDRLLGWLDGWRRTWTYRCSWNQLLLFGSVIRPIWRWPAVGYFVSQHKMSVDICSFISFLSSFFIQPLNSPSKSRKKVEILTRDHQKDVNTSSSFFYHNHHHPRKASPSTKSITASNIILKPEKYIVLIVVEEAMVVSELIALLHWGKKWIQ